MQLKLLVSVFLLIAEVLTGGFAGALDRAWLYYAYQIDGLNDPAQRRLGWKFLSWDSIVKKCRIHRRTKQECELVNFLGGSSSKDLFAANKPGRLLDSQTTDPDPE
ncbi:hypothetical protein BBK36DRAFT_1138363 [Trichoderma citrinoviride]|uniref:Uncharacterized protein n=1 Tax=Trichoderma citrinoviride TaxID=58853 RepID=A0A2T4BKZ3_9HYPO|nr:hypothetical protein BBK36DRAFT_1138363 [Trichoderma citrinoviride]PTB69951.1 hypothetical protein BBK36DRAFT_1138363 [Trichoderma citrinoviride]